MVSVTSLFHFRYLVTRGFKNLQLLALKPQITDVNLGQARCLPLQTPTFDFFTRTHQKFRKFAIQECI
jgi:hypothetical protein